jgi:hypothetical protein
VPTPLTAKARIDALIAQLDDDLANVRGKAEEGLRAIGPEAHDQLKAAMKKSLSAEQRARVCRLLEAPQDRELTLDELRHIRAITIIEYAEGESGKKLLRRLASGNPWGVQTREASNALLRRETRTRAKLPK